ncbi:MAG: hypothetical protein OER86_08255 [Phycisphaerae bacterium]|nr:hypothetical protein [Phycisphaerae bacterium]
MRQFLMIVLGVAALSFGSVACHHSEKADGSACAGCAAEKAGGPACATCAAKP